MGVQTMRQTKAKMSHERASILRALKVAVVEGATWRYDHLVAKATAAGATDEEIDAVASDAIQTLLTGAEQPLTARELAHDWPVAEFRA
ncbi:MAG: hypothetical protein PCFJNLEI_02771 [Verrucomicrobiae bacterium]|nr:hypothetical protein [Verrucomicrobiae bacterium]